MIGNPRHRKGMRLLLGAGLLGSVGLLASYLDYAYPGVKPADWDQQIAEMRTNLSEPGRMKALQAMGRSAPKDAGAALPDLRCPVLIGSGTLDPDWVDPRAEVDGVVAAMPAGLATVVMFDGAGHYPHVQQPDRLVEVLLPFLKENARA
jgi:pimeloyl-ACP methyl ester carboxylesterase